MSAEQTRIAKAEMENAILLAADEAIRAFWRKTGFVPDRIDIEITRVFLEDDPCTTPTVSSVRSTVSL